MRPPKRIKQTPLSLLIASAFISQPLLATDFTIQNGEVVTQQTLVDNETSLIEAGGQLNAANTVVNAGGINNIVTNSGSLATTGTNADGIYLKRSSTLTNRGLISATGSAAAAIRGANNDITLNLPKRTYWENLIEKSSKQITYSTK